MFFFLWYMLDLLGKSCWLSVFCPCHRITFLEARPQLTLEDEHNNNDNLHGLSLQDCGMELNDEDGHRCYPLDEHLLCHSCHLKHIENGTSPAAAYQHHY